MSSEVKQTQQHILRAMAMNYARPGPDHVWDRLDSEACAKAADEIAALEAERERLREAAQKVIGHVEGDLPIKGWLRDTDASREALGELRAALAASTGQEVGK